MNAKKKVSVIARWLALSGFLAYITWWLIAVVNPIAEMPFWAGLLVGVSSWLLAQLLREKDRLIFLCLFSAGLIGYLFTGETAEYVGFLNSMVSCVMSAVLGGAIGILAVLVLSLRNLKKFWQWLVTESEEGSPG